MKRRNQMILTLFPRKFHPMTASDHGKSVDAMTGENIANDKRDLRRGAQQILGGFGVRIVARLLLIAFVARMYGIADFGRLGETIAIVELLAAFATFGLSKTLLGTMSNKGGEAQPLLAVRQALILVCVLSTVISLALLAAWPWLAAPSLTGSQFVLLGIPLLAIAEVATTVTRHYRTVVWDTLIKALVKPWSFLVICVASYFVIRGMEMPSGHIVTSEQALLFAYVASLALTAILAFAAMRFAVRGEERGPRSRPSIGGVIDLARRSWPIALNDTGVFAFRRIDIIILAAVAGPQATGIYYLAQQIGTVVEKVRYLFEPMLAPIVAQSQNFDTIGAHLRRLCLFILAAQLVIITAIAIFGGPILNWFGTGFAAGLWVVLIILIGELFDGSFGLFELPMIYNDPIWPPRLVLATLALEATLVWMLSEQYGAWGAAIGFATAMFGLAIMRIVAVRRLYGLKLFR